MLNGIEVFVGYEQFSYLMENELNLKLWPQQIKVHFFIQYEYYNGSIHAKWNGIIHKIMAKFILNENYAFIYYSA